MTEAVTIKVLIVDDHQVVRQGLRTFLELHDDVAVIGEAADGAAAVEMAVRLAPDVVLMDLVMPEVDGITATRRIGELGGNASVIVLTSFAEDDQIFPAIEAGAVELPPQGRLSRRPHRGGPRRTPRRAAPAPGRGAQADGGDEVRRGDSRRDARPTPARLVRIFRTTSRNASST